MNKNVIIIGGGIIGLSTAYYLQKEGHQVTIIDQSDISSGASFVNAGFVSPSHFIPLSSPGVIKKGLKWMFDKSSPFYIKPRFDIDLAQWLWFFKKSANQDKVNKSIPVLKELMFFSQNLFEDIKSNKEFVFSYDKKGMLMMYQTEKAAEEEKSLAKLAKKEGYKVDILDVKALTKLEPNVQLNVIGAVYYHSDSHMTPGEYMLNLVPYLKNKGVKFYTNEEVIDFNISNQKINKVVTNKRAFDVDEVVISSGSWSPLLTKKLGIKIPLQAGKGYKIDVNKNTGISIPSILVESKIGVTPMNGFTRFAGTMEIAGINPNISINRVHAIAAAAKKYYTNVEIDQKDIEKSSYGLRPCAPDGIPYIGKSKKMDNLTIATGHAMLGWTLGPATGKLVSEIISEQKISLNLNPFNPERKF